MTRSLRPFRPPLKKSVFVKKFEIEINAWEDRPSFALWFFIGRPFFLTKFLVVFCYQVLKNAILFQCFEVFSRNFR